MTIEIDLADAFRDSTGIVFDLTNVAYVSSAGWQFMLGASKDFRQQGRSVQLAGMSENVRDVFEILGLEVLFGAYESLDAAVHACAASWLAGAGARRTSSGTAS
jgi:anti-anti-sigma factor